MRDFIEFLKIGIPAENEQRVMRRNKSQIKNYLEKMRENRTEASTHKTLLHDRPREAQRSIMQTPGDYLEMEYRQSQIAKNRSFPTSPSYNPNMSQMALGNQTHMNSQSQIPIYDQMSAYESFRNSQNLLLHSNQFSQQFSYPLVQREPMNSYLSQGSYQAMNSDYHDFPRQTPRHESMNYMPGPQSRTHPHSPTPPQHPTPPKIKSPQEVLEEKLTDINNQMGDGQTLRQIYTKLNNDFLCELEQIRIPRSSQINI